MILQTPFDRPTITFRSRVEWIDTDAAGIHHNTAITRYAEAAEAELMRSIGITGYFGAAPRVRFEASYELPLFFGQKVIANLHLQRIGYSSLTFDFEVWGGAFNGASRRRAAVGRYVTVHVPGGVAGVQGASAPPPGVARSQPWPAAWVAALREAG